MPIPLLIPVAIVGGAAAGAAVKAWRRHQDAKRAPKAIAVVGRRGAGKTTLITYLRDRRLPAQVSATGAPSEGGLIELELSAEPTAGSESFLIKSDLPGDDALGFPLWRDEVSRADIVCYLFRADLLLAGDSRETGRVKQDLLMMQGWVTSGKPKRFVLIGTSAQRHPEYAVESHEAFRGRVDAIPVIRINRPPLNNARLIVGDLSDVDAATRLRRHLGDRLVTKPVPAPAEPDTMKEAAE